MRSLRFAPKNKPVANLSQISNHSPKDKSSLVQGSFQPQSRHLSRQSKPPIFRGLSHELVEGSSKNFAFQPKPTVGRSNDRYEQEADRVAEQVMQHISEPQVPRSQPSRPLQNQERESSQIKPAQISKAHPEGINVPPKLEASIRLSHGKGRPLPEQVKGKMEWAFRSNFDGVKIHSDSVSDQLNQAISSEAFTTGKEIFVRQRAYSPQSYRGQSLLAHELVHVLQQDKHELNSTRDQVNIQEDGSSSTFVIQPMGNKDFSKKLEFWRKTELGNNKEKEAEVNKKKSSHSKDSTQNEFKALNFWKSLEKETISQVNGSDGLSSKAFREKVEREKVESENPGEKFPSIPKCEKLVKIKRLVGGNSGYVYQLTYENQKHVVIKFDKYPPERAIIGAGIQQQAGANAPLIRRSSPEELASIINNLESPSEELEKSSCWEFKKLKRYLSQDSKRNTIERLGNDKCLIMEFVQGDRLDEAVESSGEKIIFDSKFQKDLGIILAADSFTGNFDRLHGIANIDSGKLQIDRVSSNFGNLLIKDTPEGYSAIPIDNSLGILSLDEDSILPYSSNPLSASNATSNKDLFGKEVAAIFDYFLSTFKVEGDESQKISFVDTVTKSAEEAMLVLLQRGQGKKSWLKEKNIEDAEISLFHIRKRFFRLIKAGVDPQEAYKIANDKTTYRRWVLTKELNLNPEEVERVLSQGEESYKKTVKDFYNQKS